MRILGDSKSNTVAIVDRGLSQAASGDEVDVTLDGVQKTFEGVTRIAADTGLGEDQISLSGTFDSVLNIRVSSGGDHDTVTFDQFAFAGQASGKHIAVDTGTGDDDVSLTRWFISGAIGNAHADSVAIVTGIGDDAVTLDQNTFRGMSLSIATGKGNDHLSQSDSTWKDPVVQVISLGSGDDSATFMENTFEAAAQFSLSGGTGDDAVSISCNEFNGLSQLSFDLGAGTDSATWDEDMATLVGKGDVHAQFFGRSGNDNFAIRTGSAMSHDFRVEGGSDFDNVAFAAAHGNVDEQFSLGKDPKLKGGALLQNNKTASDSVGMVGIEQASLSTEGGNDVVTIDDLSGVGKLLLFAVYSGAGNDVIDASAQNAPQIDLFLVGGMGDDEITGGSGDDCLVGEDGDDILNGGRGTDQLLGGDGNDDLDGGGHDGTLDVLVSGDGFDKLIRYAGDPDTFYDFDEVNGDHYFDRA